MALDLLCTMPFQAQGQDSCDEGFRIAGLSGARRSSRT